MIMVAKKSLQNQKGLASMEAVALLVVIGVLIGYGIGYFGVVHTGIINSIAARTYAFETFDNRVDVTYFRSNRGDRMDLEHYSNYGYRAHGIKTEYGQFDRDAMWHATERSISIGRPSTGVLREGADRLDNSSLMGPERGSRVNPVWIKTVYGICLDASCGGAG